MSWIIQKLPKLINLWLVIKWIKFKGQLRRTDRSRLPSTRIRCPTDCGCESWGSVRTCAECGCPSSARWWCCRRDLWPVPVAFAFPARPDPAAMDWIEHINPTRIDGWMDGWKLPRWRSSWKMNVRGLSAGSWRDWAGPDWGRTSPTLRP